MDKTQLYEIFTGKRCGLELGFRDHFILKRYKFLTTEIFIGSAFWCYLGYNIFLSVLRIPFWNNVLVFPKLK